MPHSRRRADDDDSFTGDSEPMTRCTGLAFPDLDHAGWPPESLKALSKTLKAKSGLAEGPKTQGPNSQRKFRVFSI